MLSPIFSFVNDYHSCVILTFFCLRLVDQLPRVHQEVGLIRRDLLLPVHLLLLLPGVQPGFLLLQLLGVRRQHPYQQFVRRPVENENYQSHPTLTVAHPMMGTSSDARGVERLIRLRRRSQSEDHQILKRRKNKLNQMHIDITKQGCFQSVKKGKDLKAFNPHQGD